MIIQTCQYVFPCGWPSLAALVNCVLISLEIYTGEDKNVLLFIASVSDLAVASLELQ